MMNDEGKPISPSSAASTSPSSISITPITPNEENLILPSSSASTSLSTTTATAPSSITPDPITLNVLEEGQLLLKLKECFIYKLPPLATSSGYRAEQWDLANPLLTGSLKVYQKDLELFVRLYEPIGHAGKQPALFAECPIRLDEEGGNKTMETFVDSVVDSSRYFVVKCEDRSSERHAFIGLGFRERQDAFDLKAVLSDFIRYTARARLAERRMNISTRDHGDGRGGDGEEGENESNSPAPDLSEPHLSLRLKEGEKLKLNFFHRAGGGREKGEAGGGATEEKSSSKRLTEKSQEAVAPKLFTLPPPPGASTSGTAASPIGKELSIPNNPPPEGIKRGASAEEWTDFTGA